MPLIPNDSSRYESKPLCPNGAANSGAVGQDAGLEFVLVNDRDEVHSYRHVVQRTTAWHAPRPLRVFVR